MDSIISVIFGFIVLNSPVVNPQVLGAFEAKNAYKANLLSRHRFSLSERYNEPNVNQVFKDNILLTMAYTRGIVKDPKNIDWEEVRKPFHYETALQPGEMFSFHEDIFDKYQGRLLKTTNSHFGSDQGFKTDGFLYGDGVCHLASLINWTAKDAGLAVEAPANHDFAVIKGVPKQYGVSIYYYPGKKSANSAQNLYIVNSLKNKVIFTFDYNNDILTVKTYEIIPNQ